MAYTKEFIVRTPIEDDDLLVEVDHVLDQLASERRKITLKTLLDKTRQDPCTATVSNVFAFPDLYNLHRADGNVTLFTQCELSVKTLTHIEIAEKLLREFSPLPPKYMKKFIRKLKPYHVKKVVQDMIDEGES